MSTPAARPAADRNLPGPETGWVSVFGSGEPVTLFAHGFSGQIRDTRPFAAGIAGTRALVNLGGHGGRPSPGPGWDYGTVAAQLAQALAAAEAAAGARVSRALGVSMSAGGFARLLTAGDPAALALERIAFVLPASWAGFSPEQQAIIETGVSHVRALLEAGDRAGLIAHFLAREPVEVQALEPARAWVGQKVDALLETDMSEGVGLAAEVAVADPGTASADAARYSGEVLVLTHEDDPSHPVEVAEEYAAAFPRARLEVLPPGSILWRGRAEVRRILTEFFVG
ncbi:alpha/beta fold hydrolase [Brevibacterium album]|uniref:alpha/beta fold hydrolase n=1 Tax=Brevibacterium album TaxID=417948 RepID=UPI0004006A6A|nr:alpha/beta hydrolase [Brevibacterium album]